MALIEDYYSNMITEHRRDKARVQELTSVVLATEKLLSEAQNKNLEVNEMLVSLVEKVKANTVLYGLLKKIDIWQSIESAVNGINQEGG